MVGTVDAVKDGTGMVRAVAESRSEGIEGFEVHRYGRLGLAGDVEAEANDAVELGCCTPRSRRDCPAWDVGAMPDAMRRMLDMPMHEQ